MPLNQAAIAQIYDSLKDLEEKQAIKSGEIPNFGRKYIELLKKQESFRTDFTPEEIKQGEWVTFKQTEDDEKVQELSNLASQTCWCIAGVETARTYLNQGDFHILMVSNIPAVAIRMENDQVVEVRGTKPNQNLSTGFEEVLPSKLAELPGGGSYEKKNKDMKLLTQIWNKNQKGEELTKEEIIFLYEIEEEIEGFGYDVDPRIEDVKESMQANGFDQLYKFSEDFINKDNLKKYGKFIQTLSFRDSGEKIVSLLKLLSNENDLFELNDSLSIISKNVNPEEIKGILEYIKSIFPEESKYEIQGADICIYWNKNKKDYLCISNMGEVEFFIISNEEKIDLIGSIQEDIKFNIL